VATSRAAGLHVHYVASVAAGTGNARLATGAYAEVAARQDPLPVPLTASSSALAGGPLVAGGLVSVLG